MIKIKNNFDLKSTITCGQIFRYIDNNSEFIVILKDRVISLKEDEDNIIIESNKNENLKEIIYDYFDLNRNYSEIEKRIIEKDKKITDAINFSKGLKIELHQFLMH